MKRILSMILLAYISMSLYAKEIDITKSKGIEQDLIQSFQPNPMTKVNKLGKKIKIKFLKKLDSNTVDNNSITLKYLGCQEEKIKKLKEKKDKSIQRCKNKYEKNKLLKKFCIKCTKEIYSYKKNRKCHKKNIPGTIKYKSKKDTLVFKADKRLKVGYYEVKVKNIKTKDNKKLEKIVYRFEYSKDAISNISLSPETITLNESQTTTLELKVNYFDNTSEIVNKDIQWIIADNEIVTIDTNGNLKALKSGKTIVQALYQGYSSNEIVVNVNEVINGYVLPPEPDPELNNSTLLGIDSNNNGVRDDVERYVYKTFSNTIEIGIHMQTARAYQKQIEDPSLAHETVKYSDDALSCSFYLIYETQFINDKYKYYDDGDKVEEIQFNTIERHIAYKKYNAQFNGQVLSAPEASKEKCEFDENGNLGGTL